MQQIDNIKAYQEGYVASFNAKSDPRKAKNPYPENSVEWQSWNQGWNNYYPKSKSPPK